MRLPSKDSATASAIRVFLYVVLPQVLLFITDPVAIKFIQEYAPQVLPAITAVTPIIAFIVNYLRKDVKNY